MLSLDGVMQAPGAPQEDPTGGFRFGGWTVLYWDDDAMGEFMGSMFGTPFDLLLGRKTYEIFAAYWPDHDDNPIGKAFNAARKYVATSSREPLTWHNSVAIHDPAKDVAKLKQQDGPALLTQGSTVLLQTLLENDLVDELQLLMFPLVLGQGKRLRRRDSRGAGAAREQGLDDGGRHDALPARRRGQDRLVRA
jgi:dihydrofolate reductase